MKKVLKVVSLLISFLIFHGILLFIETKHGVISVGDSRGHAFHNNKIANFYELLGNQQYEDCYGLLSEAVRTDIPLDVWIEKCRSIFKGDQGPNIRILSIKRQGDEGEAIIFYNPIPGRKSWVYSVGKFIKLNNAWCCEYDGILLTSFD